MGTFVETKGGKKLLTQPGVLLYFVTPSTTKSTEIAPGLVTLLDSERDGEIGGDGVQRSEWRKTKGLGGSG